MGVAGLRDPERTRPLEPPEYPAAHKVIVLAAFSCRSQREIGLAGPEIPHLTTKTQLLPHRDIEPSATLDYRSGRGLARISAAIHQHAGFTEMPKSNAEAYPW